MVHACAFPSSSHSLPCQLCLITPVGDSGRHRSTTEPGCESHSSSLFSLSLVSDHRAAAVISTAILCTFTIASCVPSSFLPDGSLRGRKSRLSLGPSRAPLPRGWSGAMRPTCRRFSATRSRDAGFQRRINRPLIFLDPPPGRWSLRTLLDTTWQYCLSSIASGP